MFPGYGAQRIGTASHSALLQSCSTLRRDGRLFRPGWICPETARRFIQNWTVCLRVSTWSGKKELWQNPGGQVGQFKEWARKIPENFHTPCPDFTFHVVQEGSCRTLSVQVTTKGAVWPSPCPSEGRLLLRDACSSLFANVPVQRYKSQGLLVVGIQKKRKITLDPCRRYFLSPC